MRVTTDLPSSFFIAWGYMLTTKTNELCTHSNECKLFIYLKYTFEGNTLNGLFLLQLLINNPNLQTEHFFVVYYDKLPNLLE